MVCPFDPENTINVTDSSIEYDFIALVHADVEMSSFHVVSSRHRVRPSPHAPHKALCVLKAVHSSAEHLPISFMQIPTNQKAI